MANSNDIYNQITATQGQLDPYLTNAGIATNYFGDELNKLFNYHKPAIQNAAALEAKAYALPGQLMNQYDEEYGGEMGVGSMSRMNSILENIGNQFGLSNTAWGMVDQAKLRTSDLAGKLLNQYTAQTNALKDKISLLMPMWERMYAEEQANKRAYKPAAKKVNYDEIQKAVGEIFGENPITPASASTTNSNPLGLSPTNNNSQTMTSASLGLGVLPTSFPTLTGGSNARSVAGGLVY